MSSGSPSVPAAPDPVATANAQSASNVSTAAAQSALNNVNSYTPYGSTTYATTGSYTAPNGQTVPTYSQSVQLSPLAQEILTGQQGVANSLVPSEQALTGAIGTSTAQPLNFNTPFSGTLNEGPQLLNQNVTDAIYGQQKGFLDPQWDTQQTQLQDQLSRQGIPVGSEAYDNAMKNFSNNRTQAYQSAQDSAIGSGTAAATNLFNMAAAGQRENLGEQQLAQSNPIGLLQQIFGVSPSTPTQPVSSPTASTVAPTDVVGSQGLSTSAQQQAYQAQVASQNATNSGVAALGSAAILAVAL